MFCVVPAGGEHVHPGPVYVCVVCACVSNACSMTCVVPAGGEHVHPGPVCVLAARVQCSVLYLQAENTFILALCVCVCVRACVSNACAMTCVVPAGGEHVHPGPVYVYVYVCV